MTDDRRFIEETLPIKEISEESAKEKNRRQGNISTVHVWWARRPLAACRAVVFSSLIKLDDADAKSREAYNNIVKEISSWEAGIDSNKIARARNAIKKQYSEPPKVLDCFAGGGAIPLEAMRLGCNAYALDLNPVVHIIEKCSLYYPQKYREKPSSLENFSKKGSEKKRSLISDIRNGAKFIRDYADIRIKHLYPKYKNSEVMAYLWAHSVKCNNPLCGIKTPLIMQTWLKHGTRNDSVAYEIGVRNKKVFFKIRTITDKKFTANGTVKRGYVECSNCKQVMDANYVKKFATEKGFEDIPIALVFINSKNGRKEFSLFDDEQFSSYEKSFNIIKNRKSEIPNEPMPPIGTYGIDAQRYTKNQTWGELFNSRQLTSLLIFSDGLRELEKKMRKEIDDLEYIEAVVTYLALAIDRLADRNSIGCSWNPHASALNVGNTFGRQALPTVWDYAESNPFLIWNSSIGRIVQYIERESLIESKPAHVVLGSAASLPYDDDFFDAVIIDPPYYNAVPYADLSDFFYVWLKRNIGHLHKNVFKTPLTPKSNEIIQSTSRHGGDKEKAKEFYEHEMTKAFREAGRTLKKDGIFVIIFAHKTTSAWETLVTSLLDANLVVTASWPLRTERPGRLRAQQSAALASSISIVCRKRLTEEEGYFNEVKDELREKIHEKLDEFWAQGIRGADFFISAIGPAVEVFGKYKKVKRVTGEEVGVGELLDIVRQIVTDYSLHQILHDGQLGIIDEATRFYVLWRWAYDSNDVPFDDARKLAQALGIESDQLMGKKDLLEKKGDKVRLLGPKERAKSKDLGEPRAGLRAPMIDVIHKACILWEKNNRKALTDLLENSGYSGDIEALWNVAQAVSEILPDGDKEKQLLQGLLNTKTSLPSSKFKSQSTLESYRGMSK